VLLLTVVVQFTGASCLKSFDDDGDGSGNGPAADEETQVIRSAITVDDLHATKPFRDSVVRSVLPSGTQLPDALVGSPDVEADGSASYRIPIELPDGIEGMKPVLEIDYSGRRGPGLLGPGWNITGISAIIRCRRNIAQDGGQYLGASESGVPRFLADNTFCLDGMRMLHKTGTANTPGMTGAEYYSESGPPTKMVVAAHDNTSGPLGAAQPISFRVYFADGRIGYYGTTATSRVEAGNRRYAFYAERIEDRFTNSIRFSYTRAALTTTTDAMRVAEPTPDRITYTGQGATGGDHEVFFSYLAAARNRVRYIENLSIETRNVVSQITITSKYASFDTAGNPVNGTIRFYNFSYDTSSGTRASVLKTIKKCTAALDPSGGWVPDVCTTPTAITWSANTAVPSYERIALGSIADIIPAGAQNYARITVADVNNDGRDDIIYKVGVTSQCAKWVYRLSTGRSFGAPVNMTVPQTCSSSAKVGDKFLSDIFPVQLDGKGPIDFMVPQQTAAGFQGYTGALATVNGSLQVTHTTFDFDTLATNSGVAGPTRTDPNIGFGEFSPMRTAVLRPNIAAGATIGAWMSYTFGLNASSQPSIPGGISVGAYHRNWPPLFMDLNGDHLDELITTDSQVSIVVNTPTVVASNLPFLGNGDVVSGRFWFLDTNGDGFKDVAYIRSTDTKPGMILRVRLNKGDYTFGPDIVTDLATLPSGSNIGVSGIRSGIDTGVRVADVNLDGIDDMLLVDNGVELTSGILTNGTFLARRTAVRALISRGDGGFTEVTPTQTGGTSPIPLGDAATGYDGVPAPLQGYRLTQTLDADGDGLMDIVQTEGGLLRLYLRSGNAPEMVTSVAEGSARNITYTLAAATETNRFTQTSECRDNVAWPKTCIGRGWWLVTDMAITGPVPRTLAYSYQDGYADRGGRGFQGFRMRGFTDAQRGQFTRVLHSDELVFDGSTPLPQKYFYRTSESSIVMVKLPASKLRIIGRTRNLDEVSIIDKRLVLNTRSYDMGVTECGDTGNWGCQGTTARTVSASTEALYHDHFGHVIDHQRRTTITGKPFLDFRRVMTEYEAVDTVNWLINKPSHITVDSDSPDGEAARRETLLVTDGRKVLTRTSPGADDDEFKQERFEYDTRGRLKRVVTATFAGQDDFGARQMFVFWDGPGGVYPSLLQMTPEVNVTQTLERVWRHPAYGHVIQRVDANNVMQRQTFDAAGRILSSTDSRSTTPTSFSYAFLSSGTRWQVTSTSGSEREINDLDVAGRIVNHAWSTTTNTVANEQRGYDPLGRLGSVKSVFSDGNNYDMIYGYDNLDRQTSSCTKVSRTLSAPATPVAPANECTTTTYVERTSTTVMPGGVIIETIVDEVGRVVRRTRRGTNPGTSTVLGETTDFSYGPFNQVKSVGAPTGTIGFTYDAKRRVRTMSRYPNVTTYRYDSFDNVVSETHAKHPLATGTSPQTQMIYSRDLAGRPISTTTGTFTWDTAANGKWLLASTQGADGVNTSHTYNPNAMPAADSWQIGSESFAFARTYDAKGRLDTLTYPQAGTFGRLSVKYNYNPFTGLVDNITDLGNSKVLWQATARNATGQVKAETMNGGVVKRNTQYYEGALQPFNVTFQSGTSATLTEDLQYYPGGNLKSRKTTLGTATTTEDLVFDGLDRIWQWSPDTAVANNRVTYGYSSIGDLLSRTVSDEPISYNRSTSGTATTPFVSRIALVNPRTGSTGNYDADALGRITMTPAGTLTYTAFDLPRRFTATTGATTDYVYDAFRSGVRKTFSGGEEIALAGLFRRVKSGTTTAYEHALSVEGQVVGTIEHRSSGGAYANVEFYHRDQVGTTRAVAIGASQVARSGTRDPFGNQITGATPYLPSDLNGVAGGGYHGFQQQRHDLRSGLVDMNGRYYSARIGRFMSDDPVIANALDGRAYNPNSFVYNNPVRMTDPSGFCSSGPEGQTTDCPQKDGPLIPGPTDSNWENFKYQVGEAGNWIGETAEDGWEGAGEGLDAAGGWLAKTFNPWYSEPRGPSVPTGPGTPVAGSGTGTTVVGGGGNPHTATETTTGSPEPETDPYPGPRTAVPNGGDGGGINTPLPREGSGFKAYKTVNTEYGYEKTVKFIQKLGKAWEAKNSGRHLLIGDLAIKGGGPTPKMWGNPAKGYHKTHGDGLSFDVQIIRKDGVEKPRSTTVNDKALYDQDATQQLVNLIREQAGGDLRVILSGDRGLEGTQHEGGHVYHLHVGLKE
jgi:RHS repeat-associated protein